MAYKVVVTRPAERDIEQTFSYIEAKSPSGALAWLEGVEQAIEELDEMPNRGAVIRETTGFGYEYRNLIYRNHRIIYRVDETDGIVFVVRIYHSARSPLRAQDFE